MVFHTARYKTLQAKNKVKLVTTSPNKVSLSAERVQKAQSFGRCLEGTCKLLKKFLSDCGERADSSVHRESEPASADQATGSMAQLGESDISSSSQRAINPVFCKNSF